MIDAGQATVRAVRNRRGTRWFYGGMAIAVAALSVAGFGPSMVDPTTRNIPLPLTPLVAVHAVLAATWVLLFLFQAMLIQARRVSVHRRLGVADGALALALIVEGYLMAIEAARRGYDLTRTVNAQADPLAALVTRLGLLLAFGVLVAAALLYRHRPDAHKRLILLSMVGPLSVAPTAHLARHWIPAEEVGVTRVVIAVTTIALLFASAVYDRVSGRRVHPVSLWVALMLFAWQVAVSVMLPTRPMMRELAAWLVECAR